MADASKPVRLSKVAREFNLGIPTIVEFLTGKGIGIDASPNGKIDPEAYALVRANFQDQKEAKQKATASSRSIQERESITLESAKRKATQVKEEEPEIDLSIFKKSEQQPVVERIEAKVVPVAKAPAVPKAAPAEPAATPPAEAAVAPEVPAAPAAEAPAAPAEKTASVEEVAAPAAEAPAASAPEVAPGHSCC